MFSNGSGSVRFNRFSNYFNFNLQMNLITLRVHTRFQIVSGDRYTVLLLVRGYVSHLRSLQRHNIKNNHIYPLCECHFTQSELICGNNNNNNKDRTRSSSVKFSVCRELQIRSARKQNRFTNECLVSYSSLVSVGVCLAIYCV